MPQVRIRCPLCGYWVKEDRFDGSYDVRRMVSKSTGYKGISNEVQPEDLALRQTIAHLVFRLRAVADLLEQDLESRLDIEDLTFQAETLLKGLKVVERDVGFVPVVACERVIGGEKIHVRR